MNNFDKVFQRIKHHSEKQKRIAEISCFEKIAEEADVPLNTLETYLSHLQNMGLIKYSIEDKYIYLTKFGNEQSFLSRQRFS